MSAGLVAKGRGQRRIVLFQVADRVTADTVLGVPAPVFEEGVAEAQTATQLVVVVLREVARRAEQVEASGQRAVEEPGLGEADDTLLGVGAETQTDRGLPSTAQEVALGEIDRAEEAVHRGEAATERKDAGRPLLDLEVEDHLGLGGAG